MRSVRQAAHDMSDTSENKGRNSRIHFRISEDHFNYVRAAAQARGLTMSEFIRSLVGEKSFAQDTVNLRRVAVGKKLKPGQPARKSGQRKRWGRLLYGKLARPQKEDS